MIHITLGQLLLEDILDRRKDTNTFDDNDIQKTVENIDDIMIDVKEDVIYQNLTSTLQEICPKSFAIWNRSKSVMN